MHAKTKTNSGRCIKCSVALPYGDMGGIHRMIMVFPDHTHLLLASLSQLDGALVCPCHEQD